MTRQILVTNALPYVNGDIHLGHLVEHIQTDVWVRYQRMRGHEVRSFCGDDTHGTATMMRARHEEVEPEALLASVSEAHQRDLAGFGIVYDHYGSTHSPSNQRLVNEIWAALRSGGHVVEREVTQLFDPEAGVFLADRFVTGDCPRCKTPDQNGDSCDHCNAVYRPDELGNPKSTLSGATPEVRSAVHFFVTLANFQDFLVEWTQREGTLQPEMANWLEGSFLSDRLHDWDVSRPAPYFGFEIPDAPGHYFYVWLDAPIGYMSATADWCEATGEDFDRWWKNVDCEVHHFIGKDIAYFHMLFWPAMLKASGYPLPAKIHTHGFLTVNGEKMSKSKGTFVRASSYLDHLNPNYLRYFLATKLSDRVTDMDLNLEEFVAKVNSDVIGKLVNLASRTARFVKNEALTESYPDDGGLFAAGVAASDEIATAYEQCDTNRVTRIVMGLADRANEYVEAQAPWALRKEQGKEEEVRAVCSVALNVFHQLATYLEPILPDVATAAHELLGVGGPPCWDAALAPLTGTSVQPFEHILRRVDPDRVAAMIAGEAQA